MMERLKLFHRDVLAVRSHQWKYYVEPYSGCAMQCAYCLCWQSPDFVERLGPPDGLLEGVERDLEAMPRKQILYIGLTTDPYQGLEKKVRATRRIVELAASRELPVVILTKSPLILRDRDLLMQLHRRGLVLAQFTVLTTDERKAREIEPRAPAVAERLRAAAMLSAAGMPVHFHLSPLIPGLYAPGELEATVRAIAEHGGQCIYSNILGMRQVNTAVWFDALGRLGLDGARPRYSRKGDPKRNVYAPEVDVIFEEMSRLREICRNFRIDFISEFIPGLDAFEPSRFRGSVFRFGLPAVYQMAELVGDRPVSWGEFRAALLARFAAVDEEYLGLVKGFWDDGQLFDNTTIASEIDGGRKYFQTGRLRLARDSVMAWD